LKIAVLGTGNVGRALGLRWAKAGHEVVYGSRDPNGERVQQMLRESKTTASATNVRDAVASSEIVVLAAPWLEIRSLLEQLGNLGDKIIIDCSNPLNANFTGLDLGYSTSAAEQIAQWSSSARVVKAFNSVSAATMLNPYYDGHRATLFYCGDDAEAKAVVKELASQLEFDPIDAGPLFNARYLEPLAMLYIHLAVREGWGSNCAFKMMKRSV
jgi:NADPH-dependent F420 reductase